MRNREKPGYRDSQRLVGNLRHLCLISGSIMRSMQILCYWGTFEIFSMHDTFILLSSPKDWNREVSQIKTHFCFIKSYMQSTLFQKLKISMETKFRTCHHHFIRSSYVPRKAEILNESPIIVLYHDFISDKEAAGLIDYVSPKVWSQNTVSCNLPNSLLIPGIFAVFQ